MKKHVLLLIVISAAFIHTSAQLYKLELDEKVANANIIAEGKVIDKKSFWNEKHTMIYTANTVVVYKIFKGEINQNKVEVLTQGGVVGTEAIEASDLLQLDKEQTGIFFLMPGKINLRSPLTQDILLDVYGSDQGFLRYDLSSNKAYTPFAEYKDIIGNLYKILQQKTGRNMRVIDNSFKAVAPKADNLTQKEQGTINSFSPLRINAGMITDPATNVLTISGSGFGTPVSPKAVLFKNGDNAETRPTYEVKYNSSYMISWTDTEIKVRVPGKAATGNIGIVTGLGDTAFSGKQLDVFLAVASIEFNISGTNVAVEPRMMNTNNQGGYTLLYSTSIAGSGVNFNTSAEKATFQRALNTWKQQVGVNFIEGGTTINQIVNPSDKINTIMFDNKNTGNNPLPEGVLATTYSSFSMCANVTYGAKKTGFDLVLRNVGVSSGNTSFTTGPCFPAPGQIDLEFVLLHELGHAINLAHINDDYEVSNASYSTLNPSKLMHYAVLDYINRRSLDASAYRGALYGVKPLGQQYGTCDVITQEMQQTSYVIVNNDDCPASFPTAAITTGTTINFDLVHTTSNRLSDPQYTAVNCQNKGTFVTNNAFYAFKTNSTPAGNITIAISNYATTPAEQASCAGQGVRLALYKVNSCPTALNYPNPVACRTFTTNTTLAAISNLLPNTNYLLYVDGLRNTKATFTAAFSGSVLPIVLSKFYGEYVKGRNNLYIEIQQAINVKEILIEKSADANSFVQIGTLPFASAADIIGKKIYVDAMPFSGKNYYRLKIVDKDGGIQYSDIILLQNTAKQIVSMYPNPVANNLIVNLAGVNAGDYTINITDAAGRVLKSTLYKISQGGQLINLPFSQVSKGVYFVQVLNASKTIIAKQRVVK